MKHSRVALSALVASPTALCAGASEARDIEGICQALVHEANRVGPALGERDIYELSDALVSAVPTPMRYLEPRSAQPGEVEALVGCNDWDACEARYGDTLEGLIGNDSGPWWTQIVDTRPVSNEVFVYTAHSGIFRSDQFIAFEQQPDKQLKLMPLGFNELDRDFDTGYAILLAGTTPYVVVPPGALSFADFSSYWPTKQAVDLNLSVHDPRSTTAFCAVSYHALPRSTVSADSMLSQIEPPPALRDGIRAFLDRNLEAMAQKTKLGGDLGEIVSVEPLFVSSKLASGELARLEALLADRRKLDFLRTQQRALGEVRVRQLLG